MHATTRILATAILGILLALTAPRAVQAQSGTEFPGLEAGQRVYDRTRDSLTSDQIADLQDRMQALEAEGADAVAYVRALDASPEDTLAQVEALQQAWVARTGADEATAAAVLINRNPDDPEDARAGVFVGRTFQEGNVPEDEQRGIVDDVLIPPLRDGDVHASLADTVDRLTTSVREGPPVSAFEVWAAGAASTWVPWVALGIALALMLLALSLFGRRQTTSLSDPVATTTRPGDLPPAVAAALAAGGPPPSAVQATLLDLATRGAIALEPDGGVPAPADIDDPSMQVRLRDRTVVQDSVDVAVWDALEDRAVGDVVSGEQLQDLADDPPPVGEAIEKRMLAEGWRDPAAEGPRAGLVAIALVAVVLTVAVLIVIAASEQPWPSILGVVALALLLPTCLVMFARYSRLSVAGQHAAVPWKGYREGLTSALDDDGAGVDLDAVLPDLVAFGIGADLDDELEAAAEAGRPLRAFGGAYDGGLSPAMYVALWSAFQTSTTSTSSASGATVSGVGAGGGGGAAGST